MDKTKELTVDDLRHMVEDATRRRDDLIQDAYADYSEAMAKLFQAGVEAGLIKEGETWPWLMGNNETIRA